MHSHSSGETSHESVSAGYEVSDMRANLIIVSVVGLFALLLAGIIFSIIYLRFMEASTAPMAVVPAYPVPAATAPPAFPLLQQNPEKDRREFIGAAEKLLHSYGQAKTVGEDGAEHVVHSYIPIEKAIEYVATGKAPYRQEPKLAVEEGAEGAGEQPADEQAPEENI